LVRQLISVDHLSTQVTKQLRNAAFPAGNSTDQPD